MAIAEYCYAFLTGQLVSLWRQNRTKASGKAIRARNSYYLGLLQGFYDKLLAKETLRGAHIPPKTDDAKSDGVQKKVTALIIAEDRALDRFVGMRFPRLRRRSGTGAMIYRDTYEQGRTDGGRIVLHKGVADQGGEQGLFLPRGGERLLHDLRQM